jgi:diguanylate cyclase (GGDEF)-like protein
LERVCVAPGVVNEMTIHGMHADGSDRWFGLRARNMTDDPDIAGLIVNIHDVTDQKRAESELSHLAFHDVLTGLPNRALFNDRLEHAMRRNERTGYDVAIVYLDLDGFKNVNDSLGHGMGDDVLRQVATRLVSAIRPADTVARIGGDEFAILIESPDQPLEQATAVADRVLRAMAVPVRVGDDEMVLSASIGIAISDLTSTSSSMLRDADIAMYQAKTSGKGRWAVYDAAMRSAVIERLELETELVRALAEGQFELMYQPIVRLSTGDVTGFEALIRWHHPTRGLVLPELFVPIAEETGAIVDIGAWVLNEACDTAAVWRRDHPERVTTMAVNMSARELAAPHVVETVRACLARSGIDPALLVIELTETSLVKDPGLVARRLTELHELGVKIAIDDFGTGYSSLSYLRQFPVDILKIDQSFVRTITGTEQAPAVLRGLLDLARTLDLETIAEGIEADEQRDSLRDQRCDFGQGFLYAHALSRADANVLVETDRHEMPLG